MKKEQIIKALKCCANNCCKNCPIWVPDATCVGKLIKNALSIILEQDKRIAKLTENNESLKATRCRRHKNVYR